MCSSSKSRPSLPSSQPANAAENGCDPGLRKTKTTVFGAAEQYCPSMACLFLLCEIRPFLLRPGFQQPRCDLRIRTQKEPPELSSGQPVTNSAACVSASCQRTGDSGEKKTPTDGQPQYHQVFPQSLVSVPGDPLSILPQSIVLCSFAFSITSRLAAGRQSEIQSRCRVTSK